MLKCDPSPSQSSNFSSNNSDGRVAHTLLNCVHCKRWPRCSSWGTCGTKLSVLGLCFDSRACCCMPCFSENLYKHTCFVFERGKCRKSNSTSQTRCPYSAKESRQFFLQLLLYRWYPPQRTGAKQQWHTSSIKRLATRSVGRHIGTVLIYLSRLYIVVHRWEDRRCSLLFCYFFVYTTDWLLVLWPAV